jgi:NTP pyrophosphatase (non-canonical NTP hydrolase)
MKKQIEFKNGTIKHFQEYIADKIKERGFEDETVQERLLLLAEEVGELIHGCRKITGMNIDKNREIMSNIGEEIADVINMVFAVGIKIGLDIEKEFLTKEQKVDKRFYERFKEKL